MNYIVCSLHFNTDLQELYFNRHSKANGSFSIRLPINRQYSRDGDNRQIDFEFFSKEWDDIMEQNKYSTREGDNSNSEHKSEWWNRRKGLDDRIKKLLEDMGNLIFGGFKGLWTFPVGESRLEAKQMELLRDEICQILDCCVSRRNKVAFSHGEIIHERVMDIIFELTEHDIKIQDLEDILYFLVDCYQNYGVQMALDEMNIDSVIKL